MATSWDNGVQEGINIGEKTRAIVIAEKMLKRKRPIDEIIEDTGLTQNEVENLKDSCN